MDGEVLRTWWFGVCDLCGRRKLRVFYWWHPEHGSADPACRACRTWREPDPRPEGSA